MRMKVQIERLDNDHYIMIDYRPIGPRTTGHGSLDELLEALLRIMLPYTEPHEARAEVIKVVKAAAQKAWEEHVTRIRRC